MIAIENLTKRYGGTAAVDRLSFTVRPGGITGFLGPNGAGKSTTLRMILALTTPTAGRATVNGRAYRSLRTPLREVGALLDAGAAHGGRTARRHLTWLAASNGLARRRVDEVLDRTGLTGTYEVDLRWNSPPAGVEPSTADVPSAAVPVITLLTALESQLGLKRESKKAKVEVLVVDHADKSPTEN